MITISQIKAARGLIDYSQTKLAKECGLTQRTLTSIETGKARPTTATLIKIQSVLEENGVEFVQDGVRHRKESLEIIKGEDFAQKLIDRLYAILEKSEKKEVLLNGINQEILPDNIRITVNEYRRKIAALGATERFLVPENMQIEVMTALPEYYRGLPLENFSDTTPTFIVDDYYIIMMFDKHEAWLIKNKPFAEFHRKQFEFLWKNGTSLPLTK